MIGPVPPAAVLDVCFLSRKALPWYVYVCVCVWFSGLCTIHHERPPPARPHSHTNPRTAPTPFDTTCTRSAFSAAVGSDLHFNIYQ